MINYVKGDLFKAPEKILAHGCNCSGGYGSGVAAGMAKWHKLAKNQYLSKYDSEEGWELGDVQFVTSGDKIIANCATQDGYMPRGICHADYPAIRKTMELVKDFAKANGYDVAIPKIGAGLAGGDWTIIEGILKDVFVDYDVTVYCL
jgi:O-acetyl-ADP-ribose deacetylase (regulator of RNase III)